MLPARTRYRARKANEIERQFRSGVYRGVVNSGAEPTISIGGKPGVPAKRLGGAFRSGETTIAFQAGSSSQLSFFKKDRR